MNPISGYFCSRCKSPTITLRESEEKREKKRHISEKIKFVSVIEIECTFVFISSPLQNEPDFLLPWLAPTCHVVCHTNVRAVKDALDFQG
jgi:hypothetical protein